MASPHSLHIRRFCALLALCAIAYAQSPAPYSSVKPILDSIPQLPPSLQKGSEASWNAWRDKADRDIRARLTQGDIDTMVNLLLFGTSFTTKPRIQIETLADASRSGLLIGRVNDLVAGLARPANNERLSYLRKVLTAQLRELEADGLVDRKALDDEVPKGVEYSLTEASRTLLPVLQSLHEWGIDHARRNGIDLCLPEQDRST